MTSREDQTPSQTPTYALPELAPPDYVDPVIEAYKKDVDRTLLRENLKLTVEQRFQKLESFVEFANELREAGRRSRGETRQP
jgi:hypothetical protein